jgi:hypothetical protein
MRNPTYHRRRQERLRREDAARSQAQQRAQFMSQVSDAQLKGTVQALVSVLGAPQSGAAADAAPMH